MASILALLRRVVYWSLEQLVGGLNCLLHYLPGPLLTAQTAINLHEALTVVMQNTFLFKLHNTVRILEFIFLDILFSVPIFVCSFRWQQKINRWKCYVYRVIFLMFFSQIHKYLNKIRLIIQDLSMKKAVVSSCSLFKFVLSIFQRICSICNFNFASIKSNTLRYLLV